MSTADQIKAFRKMRGHELIQNLQELRDQARSGDSQALQALSEMLRDGQKLDFWMHNGAYVSSVLHVVAEMRNMKSMQLILDLVRSLPEGVPAGVIELLAGILPSYHHFTKAILREWIQREDNSPAYLVGIQTMCNLYIDGYLQDSDVEFLITHLKSFEIGDYITRHVVELVRSDLESRKMLDEGGVAEMLAGLIA